MVVMMLPMVCFLNVARLGVARFLVRLAAWAVMVMVLLGADTEILSTINLPIDCKVVFPKAISRVAFGLGRGNVPSSANVMDRESFL